MKLGTGGHQDHYEIDMSYVIEVELMNSNIGSQSPSQLNSSVWRQKRWLPTGVGGVWRQKRWLPTGVCRWKRRPLERSQTPNGQRQGGKPLGNDSKAGFVKYSKPTSWRVS